MSLHSNKKIDIKYSGIKISIILIFVFLFALKLSTLGSTIAYYRDSELSTANKFVTSPLSFDVKINGEETAQVDLTSGSVTLTPVMTPHVDSAPIEYWVSAQVVGGDIALCEVIDMVGTFPFPYNNRLNLLQTSTTTTTGAWTNEFSIFGDKTQYANKFCIVDLVYRGRIEGSSGEGYKDTQTVTITFNVNEQFQQKALISDNDSDIGEELQQGIEVIDEEEQQPSTEEVQITEMVEVVVEEAQDETPTEQN